MEFHFETTYTPQSMAVMAKALRKTGIHFTSI